MEWSIFHPDCLQFKMRVGLFESDGSGQQLERRAEAAFSAVRTRASMRWQAIIYNSTFIEFAGLRAFSSFI